MSIKLIDVVNELFDDCRDIRLFITFAPNNDTLFSFGLEKESNNQQHLKKHILVEKVEESNLKKWLMIGLCYTVRIKNDLASDNTITAVAEFSEVEFLTVTASTLDEAMTNLERKLDGFDFEGLQKCLANENCTWKEAIQNTRAFINK